MLRNIVSPKENQRLISNEGQKEENGRRKTADIVSMGVDNWPLIKFG